MSEHEHTRPLLTPEQLADPSWIDNKLKPYYLSGINAIQYVVGGRLYSTHCARCMGYKPMITKWRPIPK